MLGIVYSVIGGLAILLHCIINGDTLFIRKDSQISKKTRCYHNFLWVILMYYVTDTLWGILDEAKLLTILKIDTFIYYVVMSLAVVLWTDYVVTYLNQENLFGKLVQGFGRLFLIFEIVTLVVNIFHPLFFWFDEQGAYYAGPIRYITLYVQIGLFLLSSVQTLYVSSRSHGEKKRRHLSIC